MEWDWSVFTEQELRRLRAYRLAYAIAGPNESWRDGWRVASLLLFGLWLVETGRVREG